MAPIDNTDDYIDVRDVIARFEELEGEREDLASTVTEARAALVVSDTEDGAEEAQSLHEALGAQDVWREENGEEYCALQNLLSDLKGYGGDEQWRGDWYPITLIRDSYFTEAMQELCEDIGGVPKDIPHYIEIDWEATARNMQVDYSSVEFDGVTYWYR